jgi:dipeptidyl aminopeptidase/acylaminoacyl peptidase
MHKKLFFAAAFVLAVSFASAQQPTTPNSAIGLDSHVDPKLMAALGKHQTVPILGVAIAPDASAVAWGRYGATGESIEITPLTGGTERTVSAGAAGEKCNSESPTWSPDSKWLAVFSDCGSPESADGTKQQQVFLINVADGTAHKLGSLKGNVDDLGWSPDGKLVSLLYVANATRNPSAVAAQSLPEGVIDMQQVSEVQRLATLNAANGQLNFITPEHIHIYEYDWSRDSRSVVYTAAPPPGENNWWVAKLYSQPATGGQPTVVFDPSTTTGAMHGLQIAVPRISPDGSQVAFIGGLMSDFGSTGGDLWTVPISGGQAKDLTDGMKASAVWLHWQDPSHILFTGLQQGDSIIRVVDTSGQISDPFNYTKPMSISDGRASMSMSIAANGAVAFSTSGWAVAPEIWAGDLAGLKQITHLNDTAKGNWGDTKNLTWQSDGLEVQGWLTYPVNYDPSRKYPLIVMVHGGPAAAVTARWQGAGFLSAFTNSGYFVFQANPRGSFGQGESFVKANRKDFGYGDLRDILAGIDKIQSMAPIDPDRIGITGGSYGGFMAMFAPTQTNRFKASVSIAGLSDWLSYYGENSIDQWMIPYFGASVYDDPASYAKSSAINYVKNIKTPMLIIVGDRDGECPAPQSFEIWHALKDLGVPTELVVYPNEGHGLSQPAHQVDALAKMLDWFAKYMPAK